VAFDPFWSGWRSRDAFVLHVGGSPLQLAKAWATTAGADRDWLAAARICAPRMSPCFTRGGDVHLDDVIDGVFERFAKLRGPA